MSLTFYYHPLSSFCMKALIALYENDTPFERRLVDLRDPADRAAFQKVWPLAKFPVLHDAARDETVPESTIIIEYLAQHYPGPVQLVPGDPDEARRTRLRDRFFDLYIHMPMQRIVSDRLRPDDKKDPHGVAEAEAQIRMAYGIIDPELGPSEWAMGDSFTMADCAAAPALLYAGKLVPFGDAHKNLAAYFGRLTARPSFARVLREAEPYFKMFPG